MTHAGQKFGFAPVGFFCVLAGLLGGIEQALSFCEVRTDADYPSCCATGIPVGAHAMAFHPNPLVVIRPDAKLCVVALTFAAHGFRQQGVQCGQVVGVQALKQILHLAVTLGSEIPHDLGPFGAQVHVTCVDRPLPQTQPGGFHGQREPVTGIVQFFFGQQSTG